jgi:hypothetical protein
LIGPEGGLMAAVPIRKLAEKDSTKTKIVAANRACTFAAELRRNHLFFNGAYAAS